MFNQCEALAIGFNQFGFVRFLTVIEIFLYYAAFGLGVYCLVTINKNLDVILDPFEEILQQMPNLHAGDRRNSDVIEIKPREIKA